MPPPININPLPDDAKSELLPADASVKKSRGTLNWWNLNILLAVVCILAIAYNANLQGQIRDLKGVVTMQGVKIDSLQNTITSMLKQQIDDLRPAKQSAVRAEQKVDSLTQNTKP